MADKDIKDLTYFITRFGKADYNDLTSNFKQKIEPSITKSNFIPNNPYIDALISADAYLAIIYDKNSFNNFVSDIQSLTTLHIENSLDKILKTKTNNYLLFFVYSSIPNLYSIIRNRDSNILSDENLESINVLITEITNEITDPHKAVFEALKLLQNYLSFFSISNNRGASLNPSKRPFPIKQVHL